VAAAILIVGLGMVTWLVKGNRETAFAPIIAAPFSSEKLSTDGKVQHAVVSPDGKFVVYNHGIIGEKQSVWQRSLETGHNTEIIPSSDDIYFGFALSPEDNTLFFARRPRGHDGPADIYRVPAPGGIPKRIVSAEGWIDISPDGRQIAFVRCVYRSDDFCSLWIADARDGQNERKLVTRPSPYRIRDVAFSPDGSSIAFGSGQSENAGNDFGVFVVPTAGGVERELTAEKFFNVTSLGWLPDQQSLLITASRIPNRNFRIWHLDAETGGADPVTKDSESYSALSLDARAAILVATSVKTDFHARILDLETAAERLYVPGASIITFAPDGKVLYGSEMSGNLELWSIEADGSRRRQLTDFPGDDVDPVSAPDSKTIYFASNRSGSVHIWRMNEDGSNPTRLTNQAGGFPLFVSPGGEWVYFHHGTDRTLWRVPTAGGQEELVLDKRKSCFALSPDGAHLAFGENVDGQNSAVITSLNGETVETVKLADQKGSLIQIAWLRDGNGIAYILAADDFRKNTLWIQKFDWDAGPRTIAQFDQQISTRGFALSPDGKSFAVSKGGWSHDMVLLKGLN